MRHIDVFHGDADGLCSLRQLRLVTPADSLLIAGPKRHTSLLEQVAAEAGDELTVLDIPLDRNRDALIGLLNRGVRVHYFDHHVCAKAPAHPLLTTILDSSPGVCTGVLVDRQLQGRYRVWAVVAAYGDNLIETAHGLGASLGLGERRLDKLRILGEFLNYNSYAESDGDMIVHPCELYRVLCHYGDPEDAVDHEPLVHLIAATRGHDFEQAWQHRPHMASESGSIYLFPDRPWSRRIRGSFANELSNRSPALPHAVLVEDRAGDLVVSVRAPRASLRGADTLCRKFQGGGGRPAAAGIDRLPKAQMNEFIELFEANAW